MGLGVPFWDPYFGGTPFWGYPGLEGYPFRGTPD